MLFPGYKRKRTSSHLICATFDSSFSTHLSPLATPSSLQPLSIPGIWVLQQSCHGDCKSSNTTEYWKRKSAGRVAVSVIVIAVWDDTCQSRTTARASEHGALPSLLLLSLLLLLPLLPLPLPLLLSPPLLPSELPPPDPPPPMFGGGPLGC